MTGTDPATLKLFEHLRGIAERVADCAGDMAAIRAVIEDMPRLDDATHRVDARIVGSTRPAGEWVVAEGARSERRMLYLHGGSWMSGSPEGYRPLAARLSRSTGCAVFVLDYRLAPENPFPAGLDDCIEAWRWLRSHGPGAKAIARTAVLAGDSAGGNLALATALRLKSEGRELPDAVVALSPAVDLTWGSGSMKTRADADPILRPDRLVLVAKAYVQGAEELDHPWVSPVHGDFSGMCPVLIQVGDREVLLDDAKRLAERIRSQGVETDLQLYPGMPHVFQMFGPTVQAADDAVRRIGEFLIRHGPRG